MKIEVNEVISKEVYVSKLEDIGNNVLFMDNSGELGFLVKDYVGDYSVVWVFNNEICVRQTSTIVFPVMLVKNKSITIAS